MKKSIFTFYLTIAFGSICGVTNCIAKEKISKRTHGQCLEDEKIPKTYCKTDHHLFDPLNAASVPFGEVIMVSGVVTPEERARVLAERDALIKSQEARY